MKYFLYKYTRFPFAKLELYDILTLCSSSAGNRVFCGEGIELTFKIIEIKLKESGAIFKNFQRNRRIEDEEF